MASNFLDILSRLHDSNVDFVIVGGVAAALHGGSRVTFDLDVVPSLAPNSWMAAVDLLWSLGARPRIPEPLDRIRDVEREEQAVRRICWILPSCKTSRSVATREPESKRTRGRLSRRSSQPAC